MKVETMEKKLVKILANWPENSQPATDIPKISRMILKILREVYEDGYKAGEEAKLTHYEEMVDAAREYVEATENLGGLTRGEFDVALITWKNLEEALEKIDD